MHTVPKIIRTTALMLALFSLLATTVSQAQIRTKVSKEKLAIQDLEDLLEEYPNDARVHNRLATMLAWQDMREEALHHYEEAILNHPESKRYNNAYRMSCIWWVENSRCIMFYEKIVEERPDVLELKLNLALAYVDKMPWLTLGMVGQGKLSNRSMAQLTSVIEADSSNWAAWYARAMNHLHWPRAMKHAKRSIADFEKAIELQNALGLSTPKSYFEYSYIGLGDALVKDLRHSEAREIWRQGLELFPNSAELNKRLSFEDNTELEEWMKKARALSKQIDTDLSIIWSR
jgi:tetratricopeptide (TPR) repeat protein